MESGNASVRIYSRKKISIGKELGSGSFGIVYKATIRDTNLPPVAIKIFSAELRNADSKQKQKAYDELEKMCLLEHENVVKLIGMVDEEIPWLIFEYMKDGNLLEYVLQQKVLKEKTILLFCRDISQGMAYLHRNNVLHKDLAARNILLDGKRAKIADLGLSSFLYEKDQGSYSLGGKLFPFRHAAIECIVEEIYTMESDVWSFGVLMWEVCSGGHTPYGRENKQQQVRRLIADGHNPMNVRQPKCSDKISMIMKSIFHVNREDRPNFQELRHIFDGILAGVEVRILNRTSREREYSTFRNSSDPRHIPNQQDGWQNFSPSSSPPHSQIKLSSSSPQQSYLEESPFRNQKAFNALPPEKSPFLTVRSISGLQYMSSSSTPNLNSASHFSNQSSKPSHPLIKQNDKLSGSTGLLSPNMEDYLGSRRYSETNTPKYQPKLKGEFPDQPAKATSFTNLPSQVASTSSTSESSSEESSGQGTTPLDENFNESQFQDLQFSRQRGLERKLYEGFVPNRFGPKK